MARRTPTHVRDDGHTPSGSLLARHPTVTLTLVVLLVSLPAIGNGSVGWDDGIYLVDSPVHLGLTWQGITFAFSSVTNMYWQPLTWLSLEFDVAVFGNSVAGHHFVSILLHALTAGLFALLLRRLGAGPWFAIAGSALWALHPLRVESFAWIAERKDVLLALFVVGALVLYTRYAERPSFQRFAAWLVCALLALMSKPTAMVLPVILLLLDWWPLHRIRLGPQLPPSIPPATTQPAMPISHERAPNPRASRATQPAPAELPQVPSPAGSGVFGLSSGWLVVMDKVPVTIASLIVLALTVVGQRHVGAIPTLAKVKFAGRLANAAVGYARYLGMMLWPVSLGCLYPPLKTISPIWLSLALILLASVTAVAVWQWRRRPWLLMGWLWFLLTLVPNAGLVQADRFTEIPMMGLIIALVWTGVEYLDARRDWQRAAVWCSLGALAVLSLLTVRQIGFWRDGETLFRHAIAVEDSATMRYNLALAMEKDGRYPEAEVEYKRAIALEPRRPQSHNNYALLLIGMKRFNEAVGEARAAVQASPASPNANKTLAQALLRDGNLNDALAYYSRSIALGSDAGLIAAFLNDYAASLAGNRQYNDAELLIRKAVELNPALIEARRNLVQVLLDEGRREEARSALNSAVTQTGNPGAFEDLVSRVGKN